jgi:hypothetical protein
LPGSRRVCGERHDDAKERELTEAHRRIGELSMENELLRARLEKPGPWHAGGRADGRRDLAGDRARLRGAPCVRDPGRGAILVLRRPSREGRPPERPAGRRGPKPALGDADLLAAIRRDLACSPWTGEGHRKA